jgi:hypothetical protein
LAPLYLLEKGKTKNDDGLAPLYLLEKGKTKKLLQKILRFGSTFSKGGF